MSVLFDGGLIEDDLSASPARLRQEIRRLRSSVLPDRAREIEFYGSHEEAERATARAAMARHLCMLRYASVVDAYIRALREEAPKDWGALAADWLEDLPRGVGCACPGVCNSHAAELLEALEEQRFRVWREVKR